MTNTKCDEVEHGQSMMAWLVQGTDVSLKATTDLRALVPLGAWWRYFILTNKKKIEVDKNWQMRTNQTGIPIYKIKGLASYCKAETTFTFHFSILTLSNAFLGIDNREMKSESGFSFAIASQPFDGNQKWASHQDGTPCDKRKSEKNGPGRDTRKGRGQKESLMEAEMFGMFSTETLDPPWRRW